MATNSRFAAREIDQTIQKNLAKLRKPGVLTVRPGFEITGQQLTGKQAIVATVHTKKKPADIARGDLLPEQIGKFPVDVREASAHQRLRVVDPASAALSELHARPEERDPTWPLEREMPSGKLIDDPASDTQTAFAQSKTTQPAIHRAISAHAAKQRLNYTPPADAPALDRRQVNTTITLAVSPDAGYATLSKYLAATQHSLVIGMYDFTSGSLLKDFLADLSGQKTLQMVLDNPAPNETRDQLDWVTVQDLRQGLGGRAKIAWALDNQDAFVTAQMFPYAYHIKVIVQDDQRFWLSSGNLNNSNEPDPARPRPVTEDRDWHVILEDKGLAQIFAYYLNYDYDQAIQHQAPNPDAIEKAIEDARALKAAHANPPSVTRAPAVKNPIAAKTFPNIALSITPLLTPDKLPDGRPQYLTNITNLIKNAQKSVYIQLQYIESSKGDGSFYEQLLQTIADKIAQGKDVKLIESARWGLKWAEKMKTIGVDLTANIGLQPDVHNKGFVIDSNIAVVNSQNFSPAGVHDNRDAGVILEHADVAKYFEAVFLSDWKKAKPAMAVPAAPAGQASKGKKPKGAGAKKQKGTGARAPAKRPMKGKAKARRTTR
jgi:phosphatidylserine/phosphatidylglycerophosphate/cardiolipin synthase-like enzyme